MIWLISSLGIIFLFYLIFTFSRISISLDFTYMQHKQVLKISAYLYKVRLLRRELIIDTGEDRNVLEYLYEIDAIKIKLLYKKFQHANQAIILLLNKSQINHVKWHTQIGTGEASETGLAVGGMWVIKGLVLGMLSNHSYLLSKPQISIDPHYQQPCFYSQITCIVTIKTGQAIYTFLKVTRGQTKIKVYT